MLVVVTRENNQSLLGRIGYDDGMKLSVLMWSWRFYTIGIFNVSTALDDPAIAG